MQSKVGAARLDTLRGFVVNLCDDASFPIVLLAVNVGRHHLEGQRTFNKNNFSVGPSGNALRLHIERVNVKPACWQIRTA
jgi:hypothetical protein